MWDPAPWIVGGANHSAEVARLLAYIACNGRQGIVKPGHLSVLQLETPGAGFRVLPGACSILARHAGGEFQAYLARLISQDLGEISPTSLSGGRSDLVYANVEDPNVEGAGWSPPDPVNGPFVFTRVIQDVPPTTKTLFELEPLYSGIPLARIDIPINTGTITQPMIKPLAGLILGGQVTEDPTEASPVVAQNEFTEVHYTTASEIDTSDTSYVDFPGGASWNVAVPTWATHMDVHCHLYSMHFLPGDVLGMTRMLVNGVEVLTATFDKNNPSLVGWNGFRDDIHLIQGKIPVPADWRGKMRTFKTQAKMTVTHGGITGTVQALVTSQCELTVKFKTNP